MADESGKTYEATVSAENISEDNSQNSKHVLSALTQMQDSLQQTNLLLLRFFDEDKRAKACKKTCS